MIVFFLWANRLRQKKLAAFAEEHLLRDLSTAFSRRKYLAKQGLIVSVFVLSILALARPQWGFEWQDVKRQGVDILVAIDTSKSMLTQDVKPNRLERTKLAVKDLLKQLKGDRIGLIAFAGDAFLVCPLTNDYNGFLLSLNDLDINSVPRGGTNISSAIETAMSAYEDSPSQYKAVIIATDGDNLEGNPQKAARRAAKEGVRLYTVGIGTREGELIRITDRTGAETFLKDSRGNFVKSRLNESVLQDLARITNGVYVKSRGARFGLETIYQKQITKLEKREYDSQREKRFHERFQFPLALAVFLLVLETCLSTRKK